MGWELQGEDYILRERTRKPFERFKVDASRGLREGLQGFVTTHEWKGTTCEVHSPGVASSITFDHGEVVCKVRINFPASFLKGKILSDVEATTLDVCGALSSGNKQIFIVHGHSPEKRLELKDFLTSLGLEPVILDEQDDRGLTIIEKFEYYATACSFAFILMTPDDLTAMTKETGSRQRARQNVIMELGWFMAYLGRERVVILYKDVLEIPSDIHGVVYLEFKNSIYEISERIRQRLKGVGLIS